MKRLERCDFRLDSSNGRARNRNPLFDQGAQKVSETNLYRIQACSVAYTGMGAHSSTGMERRKTSKSSIPR